MTPMMPTRLTTMPTSTRPRRPVVLDAIPTLDAASTNPANVTAIPTSAIIPPQRHTNHLREAPLAQDQETQETTDAGARFEGRAPRRKNDRATDWNPAGD